MKMHLNIITQTMMNHPDFSYLTSIPDINQGDCYYWAFIASQIYGGTLCTVEDEYNSHAFIKIDSKYYDAESPNGVMDWRDLNFFNGIIIDFNDCMEESEDVFISTWNIDLNFVMDIFLNCKSAIQKQIRQEDKQIHEVIALA